MQETRDDDIIELVSLACEALKEPSWKGFVRPIGFMLTLLTFIFIVIADGNFGSFHVRDSYIPLIETITVTYILAFIGSRGVEKTVRIMQSSDLQYLEKIKKRLLKDEEITSDENADDVPY